MAKFLFFFESQSIERSNLQGRFVASLSHDDHLMQIAEAGIAGGHEVYFASIADFGPEVEVRRLLSGSPKFAADPESLPASALRFDAVLLAHPDVHERKFFPGAKTVGYFPALYFVEMPEHFMSGRLFYLLRAIQHQLDCFVFQNDRQADFLNIMSRALAGVDISQMSYIMPYGIPEHQQAPDMTRREQLRASLGIAPTDVVMINGGGAWRWTDTEPFVRQFCSYATRNPSTSLKLIIPGLTQTHNKDHEAYVQSVADLLDENDRLLYNGHNRSWKILFTADWEQATAALDDLLLISDVGVSVSPATLEHFLSHRVRVISYIAHGLGLLLASGDSFSSTKELARISHVIDTSRDGSYYDYFGKLDRSRDHLPEYYEEGAAARALFRNQSAKLVALEQILALHLAKEFKDCPINYTFHNEKVETVKRAFAGVFEKVFD